MQRRNCSELFDIVSNNYLYQSEYSNISVVEDEGKKIVVKKMKKKLSSFEKNAIERISNVSEAIERVFYIKELEEGTYNTGMILEFIEGKHQYGILDEDKTNSLLDTILEVQQIFMNEHNIVRGLSSVCCKTKMFMNISGNDNVYQMGMELLELYNKSDENLYVSFYDLHRGNLLYTSDGAWKIIDVDAIVKGSKTFMLACLIATSFLLEGHTPQIIYDVVKRSKIEDVELFSMEILIRLYWGVAFFSQANEDDLLYMKYLNAMLGAIEFMYQVDVTFNDKLEKMHNLMKKELERKKRDA